MVMGNRPSNSDVLGSTLEGTQLGSTIPRRTNFDDRLNQSNQWRANGIPSGSDYPGRRIEIDHPRAGLTRDTSLSSASLNYSSPDNFQSEFNYSSSTNRLAMGQGSSHPANATTAPASSSNDPLESRLRSRFALQRMASLQQDNSRSGNSALRRAPSTLETISVGGTNSAQSHYDAADEMHHIFQSMTLSQQLPDSRHASHRRRRGEISSPTTGAIPQMPYSRIFERLSRSHTTAEPGNVSRRCHQPNRTVIPSLRNNPSASAQPSPSTVASAVSIASNSSSSSSNSVEATETRLPTAPTHPPRDSTRYRQQHSSSQHQPASSDGQRGSRSRHSGVSSGSSDLNAESFSMMMLMAAAASREQEHNQGSRSQHRSSLRRWWRRRTSPSTSPEEEEDDGEDLDMDEELPTFISWMRNLPMLQTSSVGRGGYSIFVPSSFHQADKSCPICQKMVPYEDYDLHYVMCLTKPKLEFKEETLDSDLGECAICLEDLPIGSKIARLPCHCVYHTVCINLWFKKKQDCPMHPSE